MLTDNRAQYRPQDWYLIACDGDLVLKLARTLMIGEDERGQTVLSPAPEDALLRITSDGGRLTLQALAMDWTFSEEGGLSVQHLTFIEGLSLRLNFPSSSLVITPDFVAGRQVPIDRDIKLEPTRTPTLSLTRLDEPICLVEPGFLPRPLARAAQATPSEEAEELNMDEVAALLEAANESSADAAFLDWDHDVPDETLPDEAVATEPTPEPHSPRQSTSRVIRAHPPPPEPPARSVQRTQTATKSPSDNVTAAPATASANEAHPEESRHLRSAAITRTLCAALAAAAMLAPMCLFVVDSNKLGVNFPLTNYRSAANTAADSSWPEETEPRQVAVKPEVPQPAARDARARTEGEPALAPPLTESQVLLVASLLAEAKAYFDAGAIVTPIGANAVDNLTQLLKVEPTNEAGLRLMYQSAVRLIEEAQAAHAAGDEFLARNLAEEVLGFHPEFAEARALLDSWTRTP